MTIKPICPNCGKEITINIKKVDKLQKYIKKLEQNNKELRASLLLMKNGSNPSNNIFEDLINGKQNNV